VSRQDAKPLLRAFLAVELPGDVHQRLMAAKRELSRLGGAVRWVRDESLHVTVKFLGDVSAEALVDLRAALAGQFADTPPLAIAVSGLAVFPDARRPRVIVARIAADALAGVAAIVEGAAARLGVAPERRPFTAHVTLGRVRDRDGWAALGAAIGARGDERFGDGVCTELIAFRSDLRPGGALYTKLWSIPFGG